MLFSYLLATTLIFGKNVILVEANFPSEPIAIEAINITETTAIGTVADCQAIQVSTTATTRCGDVGVISERGIYPVNVWYVETRAKITNERVLITLKNPGLINQSNKTHRNAHCIAKTWWATTTGRSGYMSRRPI